MGFDAGILKRSVRIIRGGRSPRSSMTLPFREIASRLLQGICEAFCEAPLLEVCRVDSLESLAFHGGRPC